MGEKEQGTASMEDAGVGATERTSNLNLSKSNIERITGDPDFDLASVSNPPRELGDDSGGTLAEGPAAVQKNKTKSNQSNDRLGREDGPGGTSAGIAIDEPGVQ